MIFRACDDELENCTIVESVSEILTWDLLLAWKIRLETLCLVDFHFFQCKNFSFLVLCANPEIWVLRQTKKQLLQPKLCKDWRYFWAGTDLISGKCLKYSFQRNWTISRNLVSREIYWVLLCYLESLQNFGETFAWYHKSFRKFSFLNQ